MEVYLLGSDEHHPIDVSVSGAVTTTGIEFAVVADGTGISEVPSAAWEAAVVISGHTGIMTGALTAGRWRIYAKVTGQPLEVPDLDAGTILVSDKPV